MFVAKRWSDGPGRRTAPEQTAAELTVVRYSYADTASHRERILVM